MKKLIEVKSTDQPIIITALDCDNPGPQTIDVQLVDQDDQVLVDLQVREHVSSRNTISGEVSHPFIHWLWEAPLMEPIIVYKGKKVTYQVSDEAPKGFTAYLKTGEGDLIYATNQH